MEELGKLEFVPDGTLGLLCHLCLLLYFRMKMKVAEKKLSHCSPKADNLFLGFLLAFIW